MFDYADIECSALQCDIAANDKHYFWWKCHGYEECTIQIVPSDPSNVAWIATIERSNSGERYVALASAYTLAATGTGMSDTIEVKGSMMRVRITTDAAAACTARVLVRLRGEGAGMNRSKEFEMSRDYGWVVN